MSTKDWRKVKEVFHEALRFESGDRDSFLDEACRDDIDLRIEVESLLISLTEAKSFLERPIISYGSGTEKKPALPDGHLISHYKIVRHLASGGMGEVYLAEDQRLHRRVALKILPQRLLSDRERLRRFQREAKAVSALNHPNILTIFEFDEEDGNHLFVSEYVAGETLRHTLRRTRLSVREALDIAAQTVSALQAAHAAGVIHRDIKPENIMIREDGYVKVLDFGLAKLTKPLPGNDPPSHPDVFLSTPGVVMGTSGYVSPEQARSDPVDARSDIFSVGVVLYEMLTGVAPFEAESMADTMAAIVQMEPPPPSEFNGDVGPELDRLVLRMLDKKRSHRHQTAAELSQELKAAKTREELANSDPVIPAARKRPFQILAAALALTLLFLLVTWLLLK